MRAPLIHCLLNLTYSLNCSTESYHLSDPILLCHMIEGWTERQDWTSFQFPIEILSSWTMHVREATLKCCVFHTGSKAITWWEKKSSGLDQCPPKHPLQCVLENSLISAETVRHAKPSVWSHIQINVIKKLQGNQEKITLQDKEYRRKTGQENRKTPWMTQRWLPRLSRVKHNPSI